MKPLRATPPGLVATAILCGAIAFGPPGGRGGRAEAAPAFPASTRVVLFTPSTSDPLVARIEAELAAVGIAVKRVPTPPDSQMDTVVTRQIGSGASAAIRIIPPSRGTEVWTGDTTARVLSRPSARAPRGSVSDAVLSVIALRTVEFLRASLLDVKRRPSGGAGAAVAGRGAGDQAGGREAAGTTDRNGIGATLTPDRAPGTRATSSATGAPSAASGTAAGVASPVSVEVFAARPQESVGDVNATSRIRTEALASAGEAPAEAAARRLVEAPPPESRAKEEQPVPAPLPESGVRRETARLPPEGEEPRLRIAAGPAVLASLGGMAPIASVAALGSGPFGGRWGWELMALFPVVPAHLTNPTGSVDVSTSLFGAAGSFRLSSPGPWRTDAAIGVSALLVRTAGTGTGSSGTAMNSGHTESAWQPCGHLRMGTGYQLNRWLIIRADVLAGLAAARTRISTLVIADSGSQVATSAPDFGTWERAFAGGMVALQASW